MGGRPAGAKGLDKILVSLLHSHIQIRAVIKREEADGLKAFRNSFRNPAEWISSPFSVRLVSERFEFTSKPLDDCLPTSPCNFRVKKPSECCFAIICIWQSCDCAAKVPEKIR